MQRQLRKSARSFTSLSIGHPLLPLLLTSVKNYDGSEVLSLLQVSKLACHGFVDKGQKT